MILTLVVQHGYDGTVCLGSDSMFIDRRTKCRKFFCVFFNSVKQKKSETVSCGWVFVFAVMG